MKITLAQTALKELQRTVPGIQRVPSEEVVVGVGYTAVRTLTGDEGLASTPLDDFSPECCSILSRAGDLTAVPTLELAGLADSWDLREYVVGIAALNALSQLALKKGYPGMVKKYGDVVDATEVRKDDLVVLVGNMGPSAEKLKQIAWEVLVLERCLGLRDKDTLPDTAAASAIPRADVVFMTGATMCNSTADHIPELNRNAG